MFLEGYARDCQQQGVRLNGSRYLYPLAILCTVCIFKIFGSVQSFSCVRLFATPLTAARQTSLSVTNSWSLDIHYLHTKSARLNCWPWLLVHLLKNLAIYYSFLSNATNIRAMGGIVFPKIHVLKGLNLGTLHWELRVIAIEPWGKSSEKEIWTQTHTERRLGEYTGRRWPVVAKKQDLRRNQPYWHLDLGLLASRTVRK